MRPWIAICVVLAVAACGQREPRSAKYFEAHPEEAREVASACRDGATTGEECASATTALQVLEGRERFKRFRGKD